MCLSRTVANLSSRFLHAWHLAITSIARNLSRYIPPCLSARVLRISPNASTLKWQGLAQTNWPAERHQWPGMTKKVPRWTYTIICQLIPWSAQISTRFATMLPTKLILQPLLRHLKLSHQVRHLPQNYYYLILFMMITKPLSPIQHPLKPQRPRMATMHQVKARKTFITQALFDSLYANDPISDGIMCYRNPDRPPQSNQVPACGGQNSYQWQHTSHHHVE